MPKVPGYFLFALILLLTCPAIAQNSNVTRSGPPMAANTAYTEAPPPASSTVRGRVYYEDSGRAVKRASLILITANRGGPGEATGITDGDGNFVIRNVRGGTYYAVVNAPGVVSPLSYANFAEIIGDSGGESEVLNQAFTRFDKIIVDGINETFVQIPARRGGAVGGRVNYQNGDPAIGVRVELLRKVNGKFISVVSNFSSILTLFSGGPGAQTDDRGMYRFSGLPEGDYIVKVSEAAKHTDIDSRNGRDEMAFFLFGVGSLLNFYYPDAADLKEAQVLNVLMGQEQSEINVIIPDKSIFNLSGKVVSLRDKKPLAKAKVSLQKNGDKEFSLYNFVARDTNMVITDEEGNWRFKEVPKGDYSLLVVPDEVNEDDEIEFDEEGAPFNRPRPKTKPAAPKYARTFKEIRVEDKDVDDMVIELGYGATVTGTVVTENSKDMPQSVAVQALGENDEKLAAATVWNYKYDPAANHNVPQNAPRTNTEFRLESVASGKVKLRVLINDDDYYVKSARSGMVDLLTTPLDVKEGQMLTGIRVILAKDVGTLKGKVVDDQNHPAPGVGLLIVPTDTAKRTAFYLKNVRSDPGGNFEIKLPPGEYAILFVKAGMLDGDRTAFNAWLTEEMKSPYKVSISAEGTANATLKRPGQ